MKQEDNCIFCRIVRHEAKASVVMETQDLIAFDDIHPQAPVHVLIIPKKHITNLNSAGQDDLDLMGKLLLAAHEVARLKGIEESGYRTVINTNRGAGQSVFHLHLHVIGGRRMTWPP